LTCLSPSDFVSMLQLRNHFTVDSEWFIRYISSTNSLYTTDGTKLIDCIKVN